MPLATGPREMRGETNLCNLHLGSEVACGMQSEAVGGSCQKGSGTGVLFCEGVLWYRSAIARRDSRRQSRAVWARFVLVTSVLLFFRFGTLLARNGMDRPLARK